MELIYCNDLIVFDQLESIIGTVSIYSAFQEPVELSMLNAKKNDKIGSEITLSESCSQFSHKTKQLMKIIVWSKCLVTYLVKSESKNVIYFVCRVTILLFTVQLTFKINHFGLTVKRSIERHRKW